MITDRRQSCGSSNTSHHVTNTCKAKHKLQIQSVLHFSKRTLWIISEIKMPHTNSSKKLTNTNNMHTQTYIHIVTYCISSDVSGRHMITAPQWQNSQFTTLNITQFLHNTNRIHNIYAATPPLLESLCLQSTSSDKGTHILICFSRANGGLLFGWKAR